MKKAYSYIRMSTEQQLKGNSLQRQLELSERYAAEHNLELVDNLDGVPLKDLGVSAFKGLNSNKGALSLFLNALEHNKIASQSVLLVESLDRLSRDEITNAMAQFLSIIQYDIEIVTLTDNQTYTKESLNKNPAQLYISLGVMFRANDESATKSRRIAAAWEHKRRNASSKPMTKIAPAWITFSESTQKFILNVERANIVKIIFDMCTNTCGLWSINRYLNIQNVPTFGKAKMWNKSYLTKILSNRSAFGEFQPHKMMAGKRVPYGEPIKDYFPAVISESEFYLAQAAIQQRTIQSKGRKGASFSNIFTKLACCGRCGSAMIVRNRGKLPKGGKTFVCSRSFNGANCNMPSWKHELIEHGIFKHLHEVNFSELLGESNKESELQASVELLSARLSEFSNQIQNGLDAVLAGGLSPDVQTMLHARINQLESQLNAVSAEKRDGEIKLEVLRSQAKGLSSEEIQKIGHLLAEKSDDYYFRSSLHNTISRFVTRIDFIIDDEFFAPWEINEDDNVVAEFRVKSPKNATLTHDQILDNPEFKDFYLQFGRRIRVTYKTGVTRQILFGHEVSFTSGQKLQAINPI